MINLAVIFGGESCEHDISIITAQQLISKANEYLYNIIPIYIDKSGTWQIGKNLKDIDNFPENLGKTFKVGLVPNNSSLFVLKKNKAKKYVDIDVAILCLHGINGEDGSVASILELSKIPYINSSLLASVICMDKILFDYVCKGANIKRVDSFEIIQDDFYNSKDVYISKLNNIGLPVIIKPSRQGSSIGIQICKEAEKFEEILKETFEYDSRIIVEKYIENKKEVNIACFYDKGELVFSDTEEPVTKNELLNFNDKYSQNGEGFESIKRITPAKISNEVDAKIKNIAKKLYYLLNMFGVVRFDFLVLEDNSVYVNEVNTIPGSMANYLFKNKLSYTKFIDEMIANALLRFEKSKTSIKTFNSEVLLQGFNGFNK